MRLVKLLLVLGLVCPMAAFGQTGKIAGRVTDAGTGEALPGVNVVITGTTQGSVTDVDGYYAILNVTPGTQSIRASFIGYTAQTLTDIRVNIDLTAEVNIQLQPETMGLDEVVVAAERPVVQRDIAGSVANLSFEEIENLPVNNVQSVIALQAGNEGGLNIRGGGGDQISFNIDGMNLAAGRGNQPFTGISYTAVQEVQVQTAGFSARYGNVRSSVINVVTREGSRDRYFADVIMRYTPTQNKTFTGHDIDGAPVKYPNDPNAYFARPLLDENIAYDGTNSSKWDVYMRDSYDRFTGWKDKAKNLKVNNDADPNNNATPEDMHEAVKWYLRKDFRPDEPDYEFDGTIGGPVPLLSEMLGGLRFSASMRRTQSQFVVPMVRDQYDQQTYQGRLTSDLSKGLKLNIQGLWSKERGLNNSEDGNQNMIRGRGNLFPGKGEQFATHWRNPMDISYSFLSAELTHTLNAKTFYEVMIQRNQTGYNTFPTEARNPEIINTVGNLKMTEEPFGFEWRDAYDILGADLRTGGHWFSARDTSKVYRWTMRFDINSQLNRYNLLQAGLEYINSEYDTRHGEIDPAHPHHANPIVIWNRTPTQGAMYLEDKLEFKGMVANIGMRMDYFRAGGDWYVYEPFDLALSAQVGADHLDEALPKKATKHQFAVSPRLGVAFPITTNSKLFFNYGHFRNMLDPYALFDIQKINTGRVNEMGNPDHPMPKTVQYELGYEQNLFNQFLLRLAGYYRDQRNQPRRVRFLNLDGEVDYGIDLPLNYGDRRGVEVTLSKNRGKWVRGFVNYTYMAWKNGNFGFGTIYENPVSMRTHILTTGEYYPDFRVPEPYARANVEFLAPRNILGSPLLSTVFGDWRLSALASWRKGQTFTWTGTAREGIRSSFKEIRGNVTWRGTRDVDLRMSKNFTVNGTRAMIFADITNVLNLRSLEQDTGAFEGSQDDLRYYRSLQLGADTFEGFPGGKPPYLYIPGDDKMGDFRKPGTPFVPISIVNALPAPDKALARPLYYLLPADGNTAAGTYHQLKDGKLVEADAAYVKSVLKNKQYIDMPNESYFTFLDPRRFNLGIRLSF